MHVISDNKIESFKLYIKNLNREKKITIIIKYEKNDVNIIKQ